MTARTALVPLFLVSLAAVGYETALTRYFAVAKWSEYGYWVISIVMAGFALSGVILALFRDAFARRGEALLAALPALLVAAAAIGFHFTTTNPFNPLQLQNPATWGEQLWNIAGYYVCLLPFFFLAGVFVSLSFVLNADRIGLVYGYDLTGAGAGAALVLAAMFVVHAFFLVPVLLVPLAASACFLADAGAGRAPRRRGSRCSAPRRCCCSTTRRRSTTSRRSTRRCTRPTPAWSRACCRRAATTRCSMTSPSASIPTSPTTPACWACPARRGRSACIATATGSPRCPSREHWMSAMRRHRWTHCLTS